MKISKPHYRGLVLLCTGVSPVFTGEYLSGLIGAIDIGHVTGQGAVGVHIGGRRS